MSILVKEIERVSNLWSDWVEIHGVDSLPDRRKSVEKEISEKDMDPAKIEPVVKDLKGLILYNLLFEIFSANSILKMKLK